jgi:tryptophanyl-tRNA synthetase
VATLFIQSHVPEHAELHLLLSMITCSAGSSAPSHTSRSS